MTGHGRWQGLESEGMKKLFAIMVALVTVLGLATPAQAQSVGDVPPRTQFIIQPQGGPAVGTGNAQEARPALSLSKLYLGYWVLYHGSAADKAQVYEMIRVSHDGIASTLDARYPQAIDAIARDFGLSATSRNGYWGSSSTSAADVARFVSEIRYDPVAAPLLDGMYHAAPVAADGYHQNFGTAVLPGAHGTKFGWSNNRDIHSSVTLGDGWVAAANTYGSAATHTGDIAGLGFLVAPDVPAAPAESPGGERSGPVTTGHLLDDFLCHIPAGSSDAVRGVVPRDIVVPEPLARAAAQVPAC